MKDQEVSSQIISKQRLEDVGKKTSQQEKLERLCIKYPNPYWPNKYPIPGPSDQNSTALHGAQLRRRSCEEQLGY